jgi:hypothetical protein
MNQLITRTTKLVAPSLDYVLVDASGSMSGKWYQLISALDGFVDVLKTSNVHSHGIVSRFDYSNTVGTVVLDETLATFPRIGQVIGQTKGLTALYDAINFMARELAAYDPAKASIVIVTDGDDTDSKHTDVTQARAMLDWCRAQGWQVTFFGCDFDNSKQAALLGADERNAVGVQVTKLLEAAKSLGDKRVRYERGADDIGFDEDERQKFGGFLAGPSAK